MRRIWPVILIAVIIIIYLVGPHPSIPKYAHQLPVLPADPAGLEKNVQQQESAHKLKPDNEARIIWASDSLRQKTDYAFVYLHGFSASQKEGDPVHRNIAKEFGANLYLSRL